MDSKPDKKSFLNYFLELLPHIISLVAVALSFFALYFSYIESKTQNEWKKVEFILERIEKLKLDTNFSKVNKILDYEELYLSIDGKDEYITTDLVLTSLDAKAQKKMIFKDIEGNIRGLFDYYLDELSLLHIYTKNLVNIEEFKPFLEYYFRVIGNQNIDTRKDKSKIFALRCYIHTYQYQYIDSLLVKLNYPQTLSCDCDSAQYYLKKGLGF